MVYEVSVAGHEYYKDAGIVKVAESGAGGRAAGRAEFAGRR